MKKLTILFSLLMANQVFAFTQNAQCFFNQAHGECSVINNSNMVILCELKIYGRTAMGYTFNGQEYATLYPGQYAYAYVNANNPYIDPLVSVSGSANCRYTR